MATTPNFSWPTPDNTDLVKNGALAIRTLGDAIDASLVDLEGGTTGQVLAKASNTDMDFAWVAQDDSNAIQNAIVDAKGDLIAATADDTPARLAVGANNTFLRANSAQATGLEWAGAYTTFTPSWVNFTVGNGTNTGRYIRIGNFIHLTARIVLGTTSSMTGNPLRLTLPVNANTTSNNPPAGSIFIADTGTAAYQGFGIIGGADNLLCYVSNSASTYLLPSAITSTAPMTWGNTDELIVTIVYEAA
jgi:hypothetical protein